LLAAQPYRIACSVEVEVQYPRDMMMLLPASTAPFVRTARIELLKSKSNEGGQL
jgi:hypothetical protein